MVLGEKHGTNYLPYTLEYRDLVEVCRFCNVSVK